MLCCCIDVLKLRYQDNANILLHCLWLSMFICMAVRQGHIYLLLLPQLLPGRLVYHCHFNCHDRYWYFSLRLLPPDGGDDYNRRAPLTSSTGTIVAGTTSTVSISKTTERQRGSSSSSNSILRITGCINIIIIRIVSVIIVAIMTDTWPNTKKHWSCQSNSDVKIEAPDPKSKVLCNRVLGFRG